MKGTNRFGFAIGAVLLALLAAALLLTAACSTSATPTRAPEPTKAPAAATAPPAAQPTKAPEATKPAAEPTKAAEPAKPAAQAPKPAAPTTGQLPTILFAEAASFANAPIYWAVEKGYFKEAGVEVKFEGMAGAGDVVPFLATGQLDMAGGGLSAAHFNAYARGLDVKVVAPMGVLPLKRGAVPIVMRTDLYDQAPTKTAAALKGKKVAINTKGGIVEYILTKALQKENMDLKDVETVLMSFPDMPGALAGRTVDAIVTAEPHGTRAVQMGVGKVLVDEIVPGKSTTVLLASPKLISERPEVLKNFMVGYMRGIRDLQDQSKLYTDDKLAVWVKYTKLKPEVITGMVPFGWEPDLNVQRDIIEDQQKVHMSHGLVNYQQPIDVEKIIDDSFAKYARDKLGLWKKQ